MKKLLFTMINLLISITSVYAAELAITDSDPNPIPLVKFYCGGSWGAESCNISLVKLKAVNGSTVSGHSGGIFPKPDELPLPVPAYNNPGGVFLFQVQNRPTTGVAEAKMVLTGDMFENRKCTINIKPTHTVEDIINEELKDCKVVNDYSGIVVNVDDQFEPNNSQTFVFELYK